MVSNKDPEKSFVECLTGDHIRDTHNRKQQIRDNNAKEVIDYMSSHPSNRENDKNKLMLYSSNGGEVGGTYDFVDIITPDPFMCAYMSKNNGVSPIRSKNAIDN
jgi:hypothetical protein